MNEIKGVYFFLILIFNKFIVVRDFYGLRLLVMGKINNSICFVLEICVLDIIGVEYIWDVESGEIILVSRNGIRSIKYENGIKYLCVFEFIYFVRVDLYLEGISVYEIRKRFGK